MPLERDIAWFLGREPNGGMLAGEHVNVVNVGSILDIEHFEKLP